MKTKMYSAKIDGEVKDGWGKTLIGIYQDETKIGEFERNYHSFGDTTFAPFRRDGKWYALYSTNYTSLNVMSLPDCKPVCAEPAVSTGFCPVEVWVPQYQESFRKGYVGEELKKYPECNHGWLSQDEITREYDLDLWRMDQPILYESFAFVTGCVWGDDTSWKLEVRDISKAHDGIITTVQEWGYHPLWELPLREAVRLHAFAQRAGKRELSVNITFAKQITQRLNWTNEGELSVIKFDD